MDTVIPEGDLERNHAGFSLEDVRLEMSSYGKGDIREPFVEAILYDGAKTSGFPL